MNATLRMTALDVTTTLRGLTGPIRVPVGSALRDFAGLDATKMDAVARVGSALADSRHGYGTVTLPDIAIVEDFLDYLRGEFAFNGIARRDTATDRQHSADETHPLDQERL